MGILSELTPHGVFHYFEKICSIPHGSGDTQKISDYLVSFAKEHDLCYIQDKSGNVVIFKDGTEGYENSDPVVIQGHMDMVCEKTQDCTIDFKKDGLDLRLDGDKIYAEGTTLGGDDGIAVAYSLALLDSTDIPHPPIQAIFTVDEEIGLLGADALDCSQITGRTMINLDSEEEGIFLVSCAGGATASCSIPIIRETGAGYLVKLEVSGLTGGHSGTEISKGGANASILLGRLLHSLTKAEKYHLISLSGGSADNVITQKSSATIVVHKNSISTLEAFLETQKAIYKNEFSVTDPNLSITMEVSDPEEIMVMSDKSRDKVLLALYNLPYGVQAMSSSIEGLVQTSLNLGLVKTSENKVTLTYSVRSSVSSQLDALLDKLDNLVSYVGGHVTVEGRYPAWEYKEDSKIREIMIDSFESLYGRKPQVDAIHAGLECGLFSEKMPGLDCISLGPDMTDIHTSKETLYVESTKRTWELLLDTLKRLK